MKASTVDVWAWVLIFGGLLVLVLGLFVQGRQSALGWVLLVAGAAAAAGGAGLVVARSRMQEGP